MKTSHGMALIIAACIAVCTGCSSTMQNTVTAPPVVKVQLADARWSENVGAISEFCAVNAMIAGIDVAEIEAMFNDCLRENGATI